MQYPEYPYEREASSSSFMARVYGWMSFALAITALVAYYVHKTPALYTPLRTSPWLLIGVIVFQFILVFVLSTFILKMNYFVSLLLFALYSVSVGVTFSFVFAVYTKSSIYSTFLVAAGMFFITSLYGYFTKADLTRLGSFAFMALVGLILAIFVNWFLKSPIFSFVLSIAGVIIFTALTAFDVQKIKDMGSRLSILPEMRKRVAILGSLRLYLDFINLFLFLLRLMGRQRED